jgi:NCS1 family nucleobase:cation symporter-1
LFYWGFNRFFPHPESTLDHPETGEDIIAENDARNLEKRAAKGRPSIMTRIFST